MARRNHRKPTGPAVIGKGRQKPLTEKERAVQSFREGLYSVVHHAMFYPMWRYIDERSERRFPRDGWAVISDQGTLYFSEMPYMAPTDWSYIVAHCLLHLGMGHFQHKEHPREWNAA